VRHHPDPPPPRGQRQDHIGALAQHALRLPRDGNDAQPQRRACAMTGRNSRVLPDWLIISMTSPGPIMPRSPCAASRVQEQRGAARGGQRGGDLAPDQPGFAQAADHGAARRLRDHARGHGEGARQCPAIAQRRIQPRQPPRLSRNNAHGPDQQRGQPFIRAPIGRTCAKPSTSSFAPMPPCAPAPQGGIATRLNA
jgi:hypothetical protein